MKDILSKDVIDQIVDEIIANLPLKENVSLANMNKEEVEMLQSIFDAYIRAKFDPEDEECPNLINEIWKKLHDTHRLRIVR